MSKLIKSLSINEDRIKRPLKTNETNDSLIKLPSITNENNATTSNKNQKNSQTLTHNFLDDQDYKNQKEKEIKESLDPYKFPRIKTPEIIMKKQRIKKKKNKRPPNISASYRDKLDKSEISSTISCIMPAINNVNVCLQPQVKEATHLNKQQSLAFDHNNRSHSKQKIINDDAYNPKQMKHPNIRNHSLQKILFSGKWQKRDQSQPEKNNNNNSKLKQNKQTKPQPIQSDDSGNMQIFENINSIFVRSITLSQSNKNANNNNKENIEQNLIKLYHLDQIRSDKAQSILKDMQLDKSPEKQRQNNFMRYNRVNNSPKNIEKRNSLQFNQLYVSKEKERSSQNDIHSQQSSPDRNEKSYYNQLDDTNLQKNNLDNEIIQEEDEGGYTCSEWQRHFVGQKNIQKNNTTLADEIKRIEDLCQKNENALNEYITIRQDLLELKMMDKLKKSEQKFKNQQK